MILGRTTIVGGSILAGSLLIALIWALVFPAPLQRRVLYYPATVGDAVHPEVHLLPRRPNREAQLVQFVHELVLGPLTVGSTSIFPPKTRVGHVILGRDGILYLDFNLDLALAADEQSFAFMDIVDLLRKNIFFNFRFVRDVVITIGGQVPSAPWYRPDHEI